MTATVNKKPRVLVALSGGVDSAVCVHLLKEQGYDIHAVVLRMSDCHQSTVEAAIEAAASLEIPLEVVDMRAEFDATVITYFVDEYMNGRTPNPCITCNPKIKFRALVEMADKLDCQFIATGHYARLEKSGDKTLLLRGKSLQRDQSYMLYRLTQRELSRLVFPLANLEKPRVREIAEALNLSAAKRADSQENCFIEGKDYAAFIVNRLGNCGIVPGDFIAPDGTVCGRHSGIINYTVGQRKGLGIALGRPVFISAIDAKENKIYLSEQGKDTKSSAIIADITTTSGETLPKVFEATVKIRSTATPVVATITTQQNGTALVTFAQAQRAVASGQSLVIYDGDIVVGGGIIN